MTVRLNTLGHPSVFLGGEQLPALPGKPVTFGLLVYLAVEREATRDKLVSVFWPESPQEKARHTLSQTLYELRQSLGEAWIESIGNTVRVEDGVWVDCREFADLAEAGRTAEAVALYPGHFLEGVYLAQTHAFEEWAERHRARLSRKHRAAIDALISGCLSRGDPEGALAAAWKWVGLDPLDDGGQQHLIRLLAETGARSEALSQYDRYVALLEAELGLPPLDETVELVESIRAGLFQPTASEAPTSSVPSPTGGGASGALQPARDGDTLQGIMDSELYPDLQLLRLIGRGSMADVYLGREPHLRRLVAVKVLSPRHYSDPSARKRFEREAQAAARIQSDYVCTVHRVGTLSDGTPFLVCPFVKGASLAQRLKAEGRLGPQEVRRAMREVASALASAHKLGIIHRDVRPDNVLRADESGKHSLCDFGIAGVLETGDQSEPKLTKTGEILGHPAYISPEQVDGSPLTDRADIYSLGVLAYELLIGRTPQAPRDPGQGSGPSGAAVDLEPFFDYLGGTDPGLAKLIGRCLARNPAHRPGAVDVERKLAREDAGAGAPPAIIPRPAETFFSSLMEKRFLQIIGGYVAGGFLFLEAVEQFIGRGYLSDETYPLALTTAGFGFLAANILAWFHGRRGRQEMPAVEKWLLWVVVVGWIVVMGWVALGP